MKPFRTPFALMMSGLALVPVAALFSAEVRPDPRAYDTGIRPLLASHCAEACHNAERQVGGVDFSRLKTAQLALRERRLWRRVAALVRSGDMPPAGTPPLSSAEKTRLQDWAAAAGTFLDPADPSARDPGPPVLRRLTVDEYGRTIHDLLGVSFNAADEAGIIEPDNPNGFNNLAALQTFSPALLEKFMTAAEKVTERVFRDGKARDALLSPQPSATLPLREAASQALDRLLLRAFRRPATPVERDRYLKVFDAGALGKEGTEAYAAGMRAVLKPVLSSPHFLFRTEASTAAVRPVGEYELASRLSYFLWSSMPDDEIFHLAAEKRLSQPPVLEAQVKRMLADPKASALTEDFGREWLQLGKIATARPSTDFFPAFTNDLRRAMAEEPAAYFEGLRREDRSVLELLDGDYTYVNEALAKQYGLSGVAGKELRRVALKPEDHRGGLLGMGGILAATSHSYRTSPTLRGKYVLEVLFGTPPPPPPPNAANALQEKRDKDAATFREQLTQHATNPTCAGCHRKMDPLGFALDNYDAIGSWRESTAERPLGTSGVLPGGEKIDGPASLKRVLLQRRGEFVRNLSGKLLSYALGRPLEETDDWAIEGAAARAEGNGYRFSALVQGIVSSVPFRQRRADVPAPPAKK